MLGSGMSAGEVPLRSTRSFQSGEQLLFEFANEMHRPGSYEIGSYQLLKNAAPAGLDAHHVGQKVLMQQFVRGYDPSNAPAILVPKVGHTIRGPRGVVSRNTMGFRNARQVVARDIRELRRVYPDIPNAQLKRLIWMNKYMYPEVRR